MTEAILISALIMLVMLNVLSAVLISRVSANALDKLDRAHERTTTYTSDLVDRLSARDWQEYKAYTFLEEAPEVNDEPEPEVPQVVMGPDRGGFASRLGLRALSTRYLSEDSAQVRATEELLESELPR